MPWWLEHLPKVGNKAMKGFFVITLHLHWCMVKVYWSVTIMNKFIFTLTHFIFYICTYVECKSQTTYMHNINHNLGSLTFHFKWSFVKDNNGPLFGFKRIPMLTKYWEHQDNLYFKIYYSFTYVQQQLPCLLQLI